MSESLPRIEEQVRCRLAGRLLDFRLAVADEGLILRGSTRSYYVKQLAQQAVSETSKTPIAANEIQVY